MVLYLHPWTLGTSAGVYHRTIILNMISGLGSRRDHCENGSNRLLRLYYLILAAFWRSMTISNKVSVEMTMINVRIYGIQPVFQRLSAACMQVITVYWQEGIVGNAISHEMG